MTFVVVLKDISGGSGGSGIHNYESFKNQFYVGIYFLGGEVLGSKFNGDVVINYH